MRDVNVFISYVDEDRDFAAALIEELQENGIRWYSYLHAPSLVGTNAQAKIGHAIQNAHFVVTLWSRHTTSSAWVLNELRQAMTTGKPILPVLLDPDLSLPHPLDQLEAVRAFDNISAWSRRIRAQIEVHCGRRLPDGRPAAPGDGWSTLGKVAAGGGAHRACRLAHRQRG